MSAVVVLVGAIAQAGAWWLVASRGIELWRVTVPVLVAAGVAALVAGPPPLSPEVDPVLAASVGLAAGAGLYAATRAFVHAIRSWPAFAHHARDLYARQGSRSLGVALALAVVLGVPGEELFWRGLVQQDLAGDAGWPAALAALSAWLGYAAVNLPSANLAVVAGATVGGAVWGRSSPTACGRR
jgi:membrane protease YdiL (CAAX protease family)